MKLIGYKRSNMSELTGLFKKRYNRLKGKDWVRRLEPEDLSVFVRVGLQANDYGKQGGIKRAATARRDKRGRFTKDEQVQHNTG
jgi:hypothetical protein